MQLAQSLAHRPRPEGQIYSGARAARLILAAGAISWAVIAGAILALL